MYVDNSLLEFYLVDGLWSIYFYVFFCVLWCGYCDFNIYVLLVMGDDVVVGYFDVVYQEFELVVDVLGDVQFLVLMIFFGGGILMMFFLVQLGEFIDYICILWGIDFDVEVIIEVNFEIFSVEVLVGLLKVGINWLLMGMQFVDEYVLMVLDCCYWLGCVVEMVQLVCQVGFDDVSLDFIFGVFGENFDLW